MKCAGHWGMEVLNVKRSHFQPRVPCLCSQIATRKKVKAFQTCCFSENSVPAQPSEGRRCGRGPRWEPRTQGSVLGSVGGWPCLDVKNLC